MFILVKITLFYMLIGPVQLVTQERKGQFGQKHAYTYIEVKA